MGIVVSVVLFVNHSIQQYFFPHSDRIPCVVENHNYHACVLA